MAGARAGESVVTAARGAAIGPLPPTQLLLKNAESVTGEDLLLMGVPRDEAVADAFGSRRGRLVTFDYGAYRLFESRLAGASLQPLFTTGYVPERKHDAAVMYLQKGGEFNDLMAAIVSQAVQPGSPVFLVGENKAGIRSAAAILERRIGPIVSSDNARHCVIYRADADPALAGPVDLAGWQREVSVEVGGRIIALVSLPGVFSHGRLDGGTRFLLDHLPAEITGAVLDFGCGSGVLGAAVKTLHPECEVTLVDTSVLALEAAARTFARNQLTFEQVAPADVFDGVTGDFDLIISNPPFHQGIATNYDTVGAFLSDCAGHLRPGGRLLIVANKFLPYERLMAQALQPPAVIAQDAQYKVLSSKKRGGS